MKAVLYALRRSVFHNEGNPDIGHSFPSILSSAGLEIVDISAKYSFASTPAAKQGMYKAMAGLWTQAEFPAQAEELGMDHNGRESGHDLPAGGGSRGPGQLQRDNLCGGGGQETVTSSGGATLPPAASKPLARSMQRGGLTTSFSPGLYGSIPDPTPAAERARGMGQELPVAVCVAIPTLLQGISDSDLRHRVEATQEWVALRSSP